MKDAPLQQCPQCENNTLQRLISGGAGLIFKGSGFYETDYKRAAEKKEPSTGEKAQGTQGEAGGKSNEKTPDKPKEKKAEASTTN